jgi:hypothetical protein
VLVGNNGEAPVLLKNNAGQGNHWLGVHLQGTSCNRDAIGAILSWTFNGTTRRKLKIGGGSYLSAARPARGAGHRDGDEDRDARDQVARPERPDRDVHRPADRPLHHDCRGEGEDRD